MNRQADYVCTNDLILSTVTHVFPIKFQKGRGKIAQEREKERTRNTERTREGGKEERRGYIPSSLTVQRLSLSLLGLSEV